MSKQNPYQLAIEAINEAVSLYKVDFIISRTSAKKTVSHYPRQWKVQVMGKVFRDEDFVKAAGEAVKLVYQAHKK